jgi:hypothetical protein
VVLEDASRVGEYRAPLLSLALELLGPPRVEAYIGNLFARLFILDLREISQHVTHAHLERQYKWVSHAEENSLDGQQYGDQARTIVW